MPSPKQALNQIAFIVISAVMIICNFMYTHKTRLLQGKEKVGHKMLDVRETDQWMEDYSLEKLLFTELLEEWVAFLRKQRRWGLQSPHAMGGRQGRW